MFYIAYVLECYHSFLITSIILCLVSMCEGEKRKLRIPPDLGKQLLNSQQTMHNNEFTNCRKWPDVVK